jgi:hypothetical protein
VTVDRSCEICGESFAAVREHAKFCSSKCRSRARRGAVPIAVSAVASGEPDLVDVVLAEIDRLNARNTAEGRAALRMAVQLETPQPGASAAALSKELSRLLDVLRRASEPVPDAVDQLRRRRDLKRRDVDPRPL